MLTGYYAVQLRLYTAPGERGFNRSKGESWLLSTGLIWVCLSKVHDFVELSEKAQVESDPSILPHLVLCWCKKKIQISIYDFAQGIKKKIHYSELLENFLWALYDTSAHGTVRLLNIAGKKDNI